MIPKKRLKKIFQQNKKIVTIAFELLYESGRSRLFLISFNQLIVKLTEIFGIFLTANLLINKKNISFSNFEFIEKNLFALIIIFLLFVLRGFVKSICLVNKERLISSFVDKLRRDLFSNILLSPLHNLQNMSKGKAIGTLISDIPRIAVALDQTIFLFESFITFIIFSVGLYLSTKESFLIIFFSGITTIGASFLFPSKSFAIGKSITRLNAQISRTLGDGLNGLKTIKVNGAEEWLNDKFEKDSEDLLNTIISYRKKQTVFFLSRDLLIFFFIIIWYFFFIRELSTELLITNILFAFKISTSLSMIINSQRIVSNSLPSYASLCELRILLNKKNKGSKDKFLSSYSFTEKVDFKKLQNIKFSNLSYKSSKKDYFLKLKKNSIFLIKGNSGVGKTTLLDKFVGLNDSDNSSWHLNLENLNLVVPQSYDLEKLKKFMAYFPQQSTLFETTFEENIFLNNYKTYKKKLIIDKLLKEWLSKMNLEYLFKRFSDKKERINLSVEKLSKGEIQRICLIRTFINDKPIEIYDEPTAYLDMKSSQLVTNEILERSKNKLILIASHDEVLNEIASEVLDLNFLKKEYKLR